MRIASINENLAGSVCICSLGRVGVVSHFENVKFPNGDQKHVWTGMGLDGRGLWATGQSQVVVLAETLRDYTEMVKSKPNQVLYR